MNRQFEQHMNRAIGLCHEAEVKGSFQDAAQKSRVISILSALVGYLTESGTTDTQDDLLREIKILPARFCPPEKPAARFSPHDGIGEIMTYEDWLQCVKNGSFVDDDGIGHLASSTHVSEMRISPSDWPKSRPEWATHVVWYNK